jgi:hypothetical protein
VLANLLQQTLIFDQYVCGEQDNILQSKMDSIQEKSKNEQEQNKTTSWLVT